MVGEELAGGVALGALSRTAMMGWDVM